MPHRGSGPVFAVYKDGQFISSHIDYHVAYNRAFSLAKGDRSAIVKVVYLPMHQTKAIFKDGKTYL